MPSIVHVIIGLGNGGAEATLRKLCSLDATNSHTVISLTSPGSHGPVLRQSGIDVHCMGLRWWNIVPITRSIRSFRCVKEADILTAWMPHAIFLSPLLFRRGNPTKLVLNLRASSYGGSFLNFLRHNILVIWSLFFRKIVDAVIVPGKETGDAHHGLKVSREKFEIIHNGFSSQMIPSVQNHMVAYPRRQNPIGKSRGPLTLAFFARWHPQKNHVGLLKTLFVFSETGVDFRILFAGAGMDSQNKTLTRLIEKYGLERKVQLLGNLESIEEAVSTVDVHVMPSAFGEAFPNAVAETMLYGVPNIVTNVGDSAYLVGPTGWVVEPNDLDALLGALQSAAAPESDLRKKGLAARERITKLFPIERMVRNYSDLYHSLLS